MVLKIKKGEFTSEIKNGFSLHIESIPTGFADLVEGAYNTHFIKYYKAVQPKIQNSVK